MGREIDLTKFTDMTLIKISGRAAYCVAATIGRTRYCIGEICLGQFFPYSQEFEPYAEQVHRECFNP